MKQELLKTIEQPHRKGWDVTVRFTDPGVDRTKTFFWSGEKSPTLTDLADRLTIIEKNISDDLANPPKQQTFSRDEIETLLKAKELIKVAESLEDLPTKTEILAAEVARG